MSINLAWFLLYGEELETPLDPNKPANTAAMNAKKEERQRGWQLLMLGPGKVLFEHLGKKMKQMNVSLFTIPPDQLCPCPSCLLIREMQSIMKLWIEAETAMKDEQ